MKLYLHLALGLSLALGAMSCRHQEVAHYDQDANGVHFDYGGHQTQTINFANYIVGTPERVPVKVRIKRLGYLLDREVNLVIKARQSGELPEAQVEIPEIKFAPNAYEQEVEIQVLRPATRDEDYAVELYFDTEDPRSNIGAGIKERSLHTIKVKESYDKPNSWDNMLKLYLGDWTPDKHIFLANLLEDSRYAETRDFQKGMDYNKRAINELRRRQEADPAYEVMLNFPFSNEVAYDKPFYWTAEHDRYLGSYKPSTFKLLYPVTGANSMNEAKQLGGKNISLQQLNLRAMFSLMREYNNYFSYQYQGSDYKRNAWVPFFPETDYRVVAPKCWTDSPEAKPMIERYYGEYSEAKYKFMLKIWAEANPGDKFCIVDMFPVGFSYNKEGKPEATWDNTIGGEAQIKRCYQLFKQEYDKNPGAYNFTFPEMP